MTPSEQNKREKSVLQEPAPQRPKTLLQRFSSGLINVLPPFLKPTPEHSSVARPNTAPSRAWLYPRRRPTVPESEPLIIPRLEVHATSDSNSHCLDDPNTYHSSITVEKRSCSFCGMRGPKIVQNSPCHAPGDGGAGLQATNSRRRHSAVEARHLAHLADSDSSIELGPRPVTPERAAKRIGNPPRTSRLPPGIIRLPPPHAPQPQTAIAGPPSRLGTTSASGQRHNTHAQRSGRSSRADSDDKPASPKLHHLHGLANSEKFPYVHRNEIPKHAAALRAGSKSPLTQQSNDPATNSGVGGLPDYSKTVYYGGKSSPFAMSQGATSKPHVTTVFVEHVDESRSILHDITKKFRDGATGENRIPRYTSSKQPSDQNSENVQGFDDDTNHDTTYGSQDSKIKTEYGTQLESRESDTFEDETPRLRGGSGQKTSSTNTFSFKLKRWLLTCHGTCPNDFDTDSDADLPPPRVVSPQRVLQMRQRMNGRAPLPAHLTRGTPISCSVNPTPPSIEDATHPPTHSIPIEGPPKRRSTLHLPAFFHRRAESPINQPAPEVSPHALTPPFPHLRGGADPPRKTPATLLWLAGGRRKSTVIRDRSQSKPKKRMGGLFGMAVYGDKYGKEYTKGSSSGGGVVIDGEGVGVEVTVEDTTSVKYTKSSVPASSSSSSSAAEAVKDTPADAAPVENQESKPRASTPPPTAPTDEAPLCSGAVPVEPVAGAAAETVPQTSPTESKPVVPEQK